MSLPYVLTVAPTAALRQFGPLPPLACVQLFILFRDGRVSCRGTKPVNPIAYLWRVTAFCAAACLVPWSTVKTDLADEDLSRDLPGL